MKIELFNILEENNIFINYDIINKNIYAELNYTSKSGETFIFLMDEISNIGELMVEVMMWLKDFDATNTFKEQFSEIENKNDLLEYYYSLVEVEELFRDVYQKLLIYAINNDKHFYDIYLNKLNTGRFDEEESYKAQKIIKKSLKLLTNKEIDQLANLYLVNNELKKYKIDINNNNTSIYFHDINDAIQYYSNYLINEIKYNNKNISKEKIINALKYIKLKTKEIKNQKNQIINKYQLNN